MYGIQRKSDGWWWVRLALFLPNPEQASSFDHEEDAYMSAMVECELPLEEWTVAPMLMAVAS